MRCCHVDNDADVGVGDDDDDDDDHDDLTLDRIFETSSTSN